MKYTTDSFRLDCKELAERVGSFPFNYILCVQRGGGFVVNEMIQHIPHNNFYVVDIKVSFYDGQNRRDAPIVHYPSCKVFKDTDKVLIVDDLCDGGHTLKYISKMYVLSKCRFKTAVLLKKPTSVYNPDYCLHDNVTSWVQFPHEDENGNHLSDAGVSHASCMTSKA